MVVGSIPVKPLPVPLLATRHSLPPLPVSWVSRPRLLQDLADGLNVPVTLVSASAGFGKSLLVSEWIRTRPALQASWLSLEVSDNEWGQFFSYLVKAWQLIFPQAGATALKEFGSSYSINPLTLVNTLLNDLAAAKLPDDPAHALVVLDDYQSIQSPDIHETIKYLVEHLPAHCHLVLITRMDPPLPLTRWRSRGQMLEVRTDDLRFTPAEAAEFLKHAMRLAMTDMQIEILEARTEGWIAGLQMAALSLQGREDPEQFVRAFGGSHRYVLDYLVDEVVSQQSEEIKQFLLTTAVLDQFCGPLCDSLLETAIPYSQEVLTRLEKANLFLLPLDDRRIWFRYHHLFADLLRVRLRQLNPGRIPGLYRRAADWFAENGLWREAIHYALQARDFEYGANLFERAISDGGLDFLFGGMRSLIEPFPPHWVDRRPLLGLAKAFGMIETSRLDGIKPLLLAAESGLRSTARHDNQSDLLGMVYVAQSIAASMLGDSSWIIEASQQVNRLLPSHIKANVNALIQLGNVYFYEGNLNQIDSYWKQALDLSLANNYPFGILCCLDDLGRLCCYKGELNRAEALFQRALQLLGEDNTRSPRWLGAIQRDYSDLLRERNRLADAHDMMISSLALVEKWDMVSGQGLGFIHMGRILLAQGDLADANAMLQRAENLCQSHTVYPDLETIVQVFRARLLVEAGDLDVAWDVLENCLKMAHGQHEFHREWLLIAQARILIRKCYPAQALSLLTGRIDLAKDQGRGSNWLEINLLTALALNLMGEQTKAFDMLKAGLAYAQPQGFTRIFVDEGKAMQVLLRQFCQQFPKNHLYDYATSMLEAFPVDKDRPESTLLNVELIEPISAREMEILRLVCMGLSNREIADQLVLSVGTVKTHVHNIYGKLGVRDRPQAIANATRLGLVKN